MSEELWRQTACEVVDLLQAGEVKPSELIDVAANRIAAVDGDVNAMVTQCLERAHDHAKRIEAGAAPAGVLGGLPISVKDLFAVAGVRTTKGSPIFADHVPEHSDYMVERLEASGAIVVGKSNTPEFGAGANTFNEVFGATRNPWNTALTCGGSSGGAAVNLATGQVWLATGSDMGGSCRIPAAFCNAVGLRPSPGRIAAGPSASPFDILGQHGPLARNVADCGLMLDAMVGLDTRDPWSLPADPLSYRQAAGEPQAPRRVAFSMTMGVAPVEPEIREICEAAAKSFETLGAEVEEACPDFSDCQWLFQVLRAHVYAANFAEMLENCRDQLKPEMIWNIEKGLDTPTREVVNAQLARTALYSRVNGFFQDYDLLVTPTVMVPPFDVEIRYLTEVAGVTFDNYVDWLMHTYLITLTACPAISIPCGFTASGLPVGLQLVAPHRDEVGLFRAAAAFESAHDFAQMLPIDPKNH